MPTIEQQLTQLANDKADLVDNLVAKGVQASDSETFTSLVPKVLDIASGGTTPTGSININTNGTHNVTNYASAVVNVPTGSTPTYQQKTVIENGTYTPDAGYDAFSQFIVNVAGSGGNLPSNVKTGTVEFNEDQTTEYTVNHGCGTTPYAVLYLVDEMDVVVRNATIGGCGMSNLARVGFIWDSSRNVSGNSSYVTIGNINETSFCMIPRSTSYPLRTGYTYRWFAWF